MSVHVRRLGSVSRHLRPGPWGHAGVRFVVIALWLSVLSAAAIAAPQAGGGAAQTFAQANEAYRLGRWDAAAQGYRALVAEGVDDAAVWYNLGNAYAQMDDLGRARACYARASARAPRDVDVRANLAWVTDRATDKAPEDGLLASAADRFTLDELAVAASVSWFVVGACVSLWLRSRREGVAWIAAMAMCALLVSGGLLASRLAQPPRAVVVPPEVTLFNGPGREYTPSITLHAGARVDVLRSEGDWREIGALQHVRGWVRVEQLEPI